MFAIKDEVYLRGAPWASALAHKYYIWLERPARNKTLQLIRPVRKLQRKMFMNMAPGACIIKLFVAVIYGFM
jgi:hypothetical protein